MKHNRFPPVHRILWILPLAALTTRGATNQFNLNGGDYATPGNWSMGSIPGNGNNDQPWIGSSNTRAATYGTATGYTTTGRFVVGISAGGNGTLTMNGSAGTLTFGGDNYGNADYIGVDGGTGTVNVNAGTVTFTSGAALRIGANGAGANGTLNIGGGTVNMSADVYVARAAASANVTGALNLTAGALNMGSNTLFLSSGTNGAANDPAGGTGGTASLSVSGGTLTAFKIFAGAATGSPMATVSVSGTGVINAQEYIMGLSGSAGSGTQTGGTVNITGGGTFFVGAFSAGTYNLTGGTVNIPSGLLVVGHGAGGVGQFTLGGTGVLLAPKVQRNTGAGTFNFNGGTLKPAGSSTTFMTGLTGATVQSGGAAIDSNGFDITIGQALLAGSPSGGLTKSGSGTLTLTGANTYTGATAVQSGVLEISGSGTISPSSTVTINNGATLRLSGNNAWGVHTATTSSPILVNAGGTLASNGSFTTIVNPTLAGGTLLLNGGANANFPAFAIKGTLTVNGVSSSSINVGAGSSNFINLGTNSAGGVTLFDVNDVTLNSAPDLTVNPVLQDNFDASFVSVSAGLTKTGAGTMVLSAANTYTGATIITGGVLQIGGGGNTGSLGTGAVTDNSALVFNRSSNLSVANNIGGTGTLTQAGSGTLTLSGANSYSGTTTVAQGTLLLDGTTDAGGRIDVSAGSSFGGGGAGGTVTFAGGGEFTPGVADLSDNQLDLAGLTLAGSTVLKFDLGTPNESAPHFYYDYVNLAGPLTLDGELRITAVNNLFTTFGTPVQGDRWLLMTYPVGADTLTDNTLEVNLAGSTGVPTPPPALHYVIDTSTPGEVYLALVPESGTSGLVFFGLLLLFRGKHPGLRGGA